MTVRPAEATHGALMTTLLNLLPPEWVFFLETGAAHYAALALGLGAPEDFLGLIARFVVGFMFFWAGYTKLFQPERRALMRETLVAAKIPLPALNAWFVSANEFVFGFLFTIGALTLLSGAVLAAITLVAFATVGRRHVEAGGRSSFSPACFTITR